VSLQGGLAKLYPGAKSVKVNSVHHQAVKDLGKGLSVEAVSEKEGLVEAIRAESGPYLMAVQWHPSSKTPRTPLCWTANPSYGNSSAMFKVINPATGALIRSSTRIPQPRSAPSSMLPRSCKKNGPRGLWPNA